MCACACWGGIAGILYMYPSLHMCVTDIEAVVEATDAPSLTPAQPTENATIPDGTTAR